MTKWLMAPRLRIGIIVAGYAGVLLISAMWVTTRYLAERRDPDMFNSGMAAGGDWFLELIIIAMLLVPTFFLALLLRNSEDAYTKFAKVLLGIALSAPVSWAVMVIPAIGQGNHFPLSFIGYICLCRAFAFPMTMVGLIAFCVLAKFRRPRRLVLYALGIEITSAILPFALASIK
ncbi:MAG: hypothetical protein ABSD53_21495 [Terriglobales bacterium]